MTRENLPLTKSPLSVLLLEDNPTDAELAQMLLEQAGFEARLHLVETRIDFCRALEDRVFDIIISDFSMPSFDGITALGLAQEMKPHLPFILFSGTIGEEAAVQSLKNGATDYIIKHRPERLGPAVRRALRDVEELSRRKQAEEALKRQERWHRALNENALDVVAVIDVKGAFKYVSPSVEHVLGWAPDELIGRAALDLAHSEDLTQCVQADFERAIRNPQTVVRQELRAGHRDGSWRCLEIIGHNLLEDPVVAGFIAHARDVTEKKRLEEKAQRAQRLESVGALAGGIAHDLNNILAPILMAVDLLQNELSSETEKTMLETIRKSVRRGGDMVRQILSFTRGASSKRARLQLTPLIKEMAKLVQDTFPRSIRVQTKTADDLLPVLGDATQLDQVLLNLCINARDAMPEGGELLIEASNVDFENKTFSGLDKPVSGTFARVSVSDTGTGIPPELLDKIFEPYFSTKDPEKGTGLGFATVLSIVKNHGGFVEVSSRVGEGTQVQVFLPATDRATQASEPPEPEAAPSGRGELILVVEDELALLELAMHTLENHGYRVLTAKNGVEALCLYQRRGREIAAVITDVMMPVMDGPTLVGQLRRFDPDVKIIYVSGLASARKLAELEKSRAKAILMKPFSGAKLLTILRQALD